MKVFREKETGEKEQIGDLYTEYEVKQMVEQEKTEQKKEMDYAVCKMKEEFSKEIQSKENTYKAIIDDLQTENEFYKNIIKSVLHIKE